MRTISISGTHEQIQTAIHDIETLLAGGRVDDGTYAPGSHASGMGSGMQSHQPMGQPHGMYGAMGQYGMMMAAPMGAAPGYAPYAQPNAAVYQPNMYGMYGAAAPSAVPQPYPYAQPMAQHQMYAAPAVAAAPVAQPIVSAKQATAHLDKAQEAQLHQILQQLQPLQCTPEIWEQYRQHYKQYSFDLPDLTTSTAIFQEIHDKRN